MPKKNNLYPFMHFFFYKTMIINNNDNNKFKINLSLLEEKFIYESLV